MLEFSYPWMFLLLPLPVLIYYLAPAYREDWRHTGFLVAILAWLGAMNFVELSRYAVLRGGFLGSYLLFCIGAMLVGFEWVSWRRRRRASAEP